MRLYEVKTVVLKNIFDLLYWLIESNLLC